VAPQRTALAWTRTALTAAACALLLLRLAAGSPPRLAGALAVGTAAAAGLGVVARSRGRQLRTAPVAGDAAWAAAVATVVTVLLAAAAAVLVALH
jgi:hypothetical protein